jgi:two-component system nitrate/nitrite response regulator NarL
LIVDDHEIVRMGVNLLLRGTPQLEVCGEAASGGEALAKIAELRPDMVVLDLSLPEMNGYQVFSEIRRMAPDTKVIFFTMHNTPATAREIGADGFVAKTSATGELASTLVNLLPTSPASARKVQPLDPT